MNRRIPSILIASLALAILAGGGVMYVLSPSAQAQATQDQAAQTQDAQQGPANLGQAFPNLLEEIKKTEGCLGVEAAQTQAGKQVLFAWFEDKAAAVRWYESEYHQTMMYRFFPDTPGDGMDDIPDDVGPIMAIASVTPATDQRVGQLPISQISIELYTPLQGGLDFGGTFAPASLKEKIKPIAEN